MNLAAEPVGADSIVSPDPGGCARIRADPDRREARRRRSRFAWLAKANATVSYGLRRGVSARARTSRRAIGARALVTRRSWRFGAFFRRAFSRRAALGALPGAVLPGEILAIAIPLRF